MGRPPIGKTAMTDAERMRRYRLKHGKDKPVTKPASPKLVKELAQAKARIAELEAKLWDVEIATWKTKVARERKRRPASGRKGSPRR
jgi:hypothetical protein